MKDIKNINLGGYPFMINVEAYEILDHYLHTIERHFSKTSGFEDIVSDIETRMAEIWKDEFADKKILTKNDVELAISVMGRPEDFGDDSNYEEKYNDLPITEFNFGRKLMRDPQDKIIGGVCSGLAAYFGISDPIWVRGLFAVLFFTAGFGFIPYIILYVVMPEAITASDRLEMRGEDINVDNIANEIEDGFEKFTDKVTEFTDKLSNKK